MYILIIIVTIIAEIAAIILVLGRLKKESQREISESDSDSLSAFSSYDMIKKFLKLCGVYFFSEKKGRITITNVGHLEALTVATTLESVEEVSELLKTTEEGTHSIDVRCSLSDDGEQHWYELRLRVVKGLRGNIVRDGIIIPVDKRKKEENELLEMHTRSINAQERDNFVHEMNHMIRTPLNAIVGFSDILADPDYELSEEEIDIYKETIEENTENLLKIIEDVLTISHMENENIFLDNQHLYLTDVFAKAIENDREALEDAGIEIVPGEFSEESMIYADPRVVQKIIHNLIDNVIKHASGGKYLSYGWKQLSDDEVEFFIQDKGPGMSPDELPFIYKAFYKCNPFSEGAGQGLAIAKGYLKHENGSIRCESALGQGATFFVKLMSHAPMLVAALLLFSSCTMLEITPLNVVLTAIPAILGCFLIYLLIKLIAVTRRTFRQKIDALDRKEISHTLNALGGHLFKIEDNKIIITRESADYFSFEKNELSFDSTLESLDESNREAFTTLLNSEPGKMTEVEVSVPNFRTFKIMSFTALATIMTDKNGNRIPMGLFYSVEKAMERMEKLKETYLLEEESKEKQSFLARVGHEIRTPLNAIVGFSNLLIASHSESSAEDKRDYANIIRDNNELLLEILDSSLMAGSERDEVMKKSMIVTQISALMEELYLTHQVLIPSHLKFSLKKGEEALVFISRTSIRQVVSNLINNACKFTKSGSITLGWYTDEDSLYIYVKDTGKGISKNDQQNIFSQFYKVDSVSSGAGIGLPLCKRLVEVMNGTLSVESEVGKGSCFTIKFPKVK